MLNRVVTNNPSQLFGQLQSNGRVFLINPAGILVGAGAVVDTAGFVASTLNLSNADFLAGRFNFTATPGAGKIENYGTISTPSGGSVYLVGAQVDNHGIINAPNGEVLLAAGQTAQLIDTGTPGVRVELAADTEQALNVGQILAESGRVGMVGAIVKNSGKISANSVTSEGGRVFLKATQDAYVEQAGRIEATGTTGGTVEVLGKRVALLDAASIDASGTNGGGTILVGGDYQGKNADIQNATISYVGEQVSLKADATLAGNGGKVIVWADDTTHFYGDISARGGSQSGNGGFVEVSGKRYLDFQGMVSTAAAQGLVGTLLLDPSNITISGTGTLPSHGSHPSYFDSGFGESTLSVSSLVSQLGGTDVVVQSTGSNGTGNITVGTDITWASANKLTLNSAVVGSTGTISIEGRITATKETAVLELQAALGGITQTPGSIIQTPTLNITSLGSVTLPEANKVGTLSATMTGAGSLTFSNDQSLTLSGLSNTAPEFSGPTADILTTAGDLTVTGPVNWQGVGRLGLTAANALNINSSITAGSNASGQIMLNAGAGGVTSTAAITTGELDVASVGQVDLAQAANAVGVLSANVTGGSFAFKNNGGFAVGAVARNGVTATGNVALTNIGSGSIEVNDNVTSSAGDVLISNFAGLINVDLDKTVSGKVVDIATTSGDIAIYGKVSGTTSASINAATGSISTGTAGLVSAPNIHLQTVAGSPGAVGTSTSSFNTSSTGGTGNVDIFLGSAAASGPSAVYLSHTGDATLSQVYTKSDATIDIAASNDLTIGTAISTTGDLTLRAGNTLTQGSNDTPLSAANITLSADRMVLAGAIDASENGTVWLKPNSSGRTIDLGSETDVATNKLELSAAELALLSATGTGKLRIGDASAGQINISAPIAISTDASYNLVLESGSGVTQASDAAIAVDTLLVKAGGNVALDTAGNEVGTIAANVTGNFAFTNSAAIAVGTASGTSGITASGDITLEASGQNKQLTVNQAVTSTSGNVSYTADQLVFNSTTTASGAGKYVELKPYSAAKKIEFSESADAGDFWRLSTTELDKISTPWLKVGSAANTGGIAVNQAVDLGSSSLGLITAGDINLNQAISAASIDIATVGVGKALTVASGAPLSAGAVTLTADRMDLHDTIKATANNPNGVVWLKPSSEGWNIDLGSTCDGANNTLELSADELKLVSAITKLRVGDLGAGNIKISAPINVSGTANVLVLESLGGVTQDAAAAISVDNLLVKSLGDVALDTASNYVATVAADLSFAPDKSYRFKNAYGISVGTVGGVKGIKTSKTSGATIDLKAQNGAISQTDGATLVGHTLIASATNGISLGEANEVKNVSASNSESGNIKLDNIGGLTTDVVYNGAGNVSIVAHSPLTIGGSGVSAHGDIVLSAGATGTGATGDDLTINGPVTSGHNIVLTAGNSITGPGVITAANGSVTRTPNLNQPTPPPPPPPPTPATPTIDQCVANPALAGCSTVLPTIAVCTTTPSAPGCSAVLPTIAVCTTTPSAPGCSAVLPTIAVCTSTPSAPGCSAVLPTIAVCTTTPSAPGCSAVLPTIAVCTSTPSAPGCSAVLPTIAVCTSTPSAPGCSAVLPTIAVCTSTPSAPGCSAVLPTIAVCTTTPSAPGCSAVLPTIAVCTTTPSAPGCSAVLPTIAVCTSTPSAPGCSAVLPTIAVCTTTPSAPGCSAVLPTIAVCTSTPSAPGCSAVLPTIAVCTSTPSAPGCSAVLPTIAVCTSTPSAPGCSAVLPTIAVCTTTPSAPGCSAVLPTIAVCTTNPTAVGCATAPASVPTAVATPVPAAALAVVAEPLQAVQGQTSTAMDTIQSTAQPSSSPAASSPVALPPQPPVIGIAQQKPLQTLPGGVVGGEAPDTFGSAPATSASGTADASAPAKDDGKSDRKPGQCTA